MKEAKIVILAGQSNAVGVGHVKHLPDHFSAEKIEEFKSGYKNTLINYYSHDKKSNGFVPISLGCTEVSKETIGPELGIAEALTAKYPNEEIFIVKCAFGGTDLHRDWLPKSVRPEGEPASERGIGWCSYEFDKILAESITYLKENGYTPNIRAFCWMQGESDADTELRVSEYEELYDTLIKDMNADFGEYLKDCIYVDAGISDIWNFYKELNEIKLNYSKKAPNRRFIDTIANGLTTKNEPVEEPDIFHYDSDSVIKLGNLFAEHISL